MTDQIVEPPLRETFIQAEALKPGGRHQATVDALAVTAANAVTRWDAAGVEAAVERIESYGCAPTRAILLANLMRSHGFNSACSRMIRLLPEASRELPAYALTSCINELRPGYADETELGAVRAAYAEGIARTLQIARMASREALASMFPDSLSAMPFYLAYQGFRDRSLQADYGEIVTRIGRAAVRPHKFEAPTAPTDRIRLVFVTAFCYVHSVMKMCISWIEQISRSRFEISFLHVGRVSDEMTQRVQDAVSHFEYGERSTEAWRDIVNRLTPHVIVYLEIGMDASTLALAAQRLAPVQCVTWGHPQTSGLKSIDYFLSSDLMEPEDGDADYTETLVRLPNLSVSYSPLKTESTALDRALIGASTDDTIYLCCQSIFKYLPRFDYVFSRIAVQVPKSRFVFICRRQDPAARSLEARLRRTFLELGLQFSDYIVFCEPLPFSQFASFLRMGDVFLDSIGWSGANTTLEAVDVDLPVVTFPTGRMRGRHSYAFLTMMGLSDGIAKSAEEYIAKAASLSDPAQRSAYQAKIRHEKSRLFGDETPIRALEEFLTQSVEQYYATGMPKG